MSNNSLKILLALAVITAMLLSACGPTEAPAPAQPAPPAAATEAPAAEEAAAPAAEATKPPAEEAAPTEEPAPAEEAAAPGVDPTGQTVVFWHVWGTGGPSEALQAIVDEFNASNEWGITVEALEQGQYNNLEDAFNAAVQSGELPDLVTGSTNAMANWYAVDAVVDLSPYIDDPNYGLTAEERAAFFRGSLDGGRAADGTLFAFPISQSANVLFYNAGWARELGFENAPTNYEEI